MRDEAAELARLEERLLRGDMPGVEARGLLLETVRHFRRCRHRRGARGSSERRAPRGSGPPRRKRGHGRLAAADYSGAERIACPHPDLKAGDLCPLSNCQGKLYLLRPTREVELLAAPPVQAIVYERETLRCASRQTVFTAGLPAEAYGAKYRPSVDAVLAVMRYGLGMPHHRLEQWQSWAGVPLPASTQFERVETLANAVAPVHRHLEEVAANQAVLFSDDTGVRILALQQQIRAQPPGERTGTYTTGMVARGLRDNGPAVALYASGRAHAGENLDRLLAKRAAQEADLIHMADAAAREPSFERRIKARCLAHARRYCVEAEEAFPEECRHVLDAIATVYGNEAQTRGMDPQARLHYHQQHSAGVLEALSEWIEEQFRERRVEPNGQLGKAFQYVQNHWEGLTRFLHVGGVPLDNNPVERELKPALRHRKNSLFYKTEAGAWVGDVLMSAIRTCVLNRVDPVDYLKALGQHSTRARASPKAWLPWTYKETLAALN
jgi:hypothetical protein